MSNPSIRQPLGFFYNNNTVLKSDSFDRLIKNKYPPLNLVVSFKSVRNNFRKNFVRQPVQIYCYVVG